MNTQEAFNKICDHLMTQNSKAVSIQGDCRYRGEDGKMCAIGCLIPDDVYSSGMEGKNVRGTLFDGNEPLRRLFADIDFGMLGDCQDVHDQEPLSSWANKLRDIAAWHGLTKPASITSIYHE